MTIQRIDPPQAGDEAAVLRGFLAYHRDTLRLKTSGLDQAELSATLAPSSMTLGGMMKHLAYVENWWFRSVFLGEQEGEPWSSVDWDADPDWDWHSAVDDTPDQLRNLFEAEVAAAESVTDAATSLDQLSVRRGRNGEPFSLRWILVHMIEEYARHNGHADLIRESIDGSVGE